MACWRDNLTHKKMAQIQLKSVVWQEGPHFVAQCLDVDVASFGDTRDEALHNLDEALALYFEDEAVPTQPLVQSPEVVDTIVEYA
jgi:predicted RNase H-like HicB family nuclease